VKECLFSQFNCLFFFFISTIIVGSLGIHFGIYFRFFGFVSSVVVAVALWMCLDREYIYS
jgi:hypothetical protein